MNKFLQSIKEPLKEGARVIVLSVIPIFIVSLEKMEFNWKSIMVVGGVALLKFIDKYLHDKEPAGKSGGLTGF